MTTALIKYKENGKRSASVAGSVSVSQHLFKSLVYSQAKLLHQEKKRHKASEGILQPGEKAVVED